MEGGINMDNNQQTPSQPASKPEVTSVVPEATITPSVTNLGIHEPKVMGGSIQSPLTGANESMTTGAAFGGPIVSTEQGSVENATRP